MFSIQFATRLFCEKNIMDTISKYEWSKSKNELDRAHINMDINEHTVPGTVFWVLHLYYLIPTSQ